MYEGELMVLQYFGYHNSTALYTFTEILKVTIHFELPRSSYFHTGFASKAWRTASESTHLGLPDLA